MLLHDRLKPFRVILASHSPRRQQLIRDAGIDYILADCYDVEEVYPDTLAPEEVPLYLSRLKSSSYPEPLNETDILITADTVVCINDCVLGKPSDREDAIRIIGLLSGNRHEVVTGVTLRSIGHSFSFSAKSTVYFRKLTREEIEYYVDTYKPYDKAGAYGIQEWIGYVGIEGIEGSFYNVMGLPIQQLYIHLERFIKQI